MFVLIFQLTIEHVLEMLVERYVKMGANQYLRDYRLSAKLKKTAELRKKVLQKNEKRKQKNDSVPFQVIFIQIFLYL